MKKYRKIPHIVEAIQILEDTKHYAIADYWDTFWVVMTLEGRMSGNYGDYLVKGIDGEYYPVKQRIFEKSYEEIKDEKI